MLGRSQLRQAAKIRIHVDGRTRLDELICDGVLVAIGFGIGVVGVAFSYGFLVAVLTGASRLI